MGKQSAPPMGGYSPSGTPSQSDVYKQFGAPPTDLGGLSRWADNVKNAYPGGVKTPYQSAAEAQATANRPTQNSPFASSSWTQDANGNWTQNSSLAPGLQGAASGFMDQLSNGSGPQARQKAEDALYARSTSRLNPMWDQQQSQMQQQLANSGLDITSEAGQRAQALFGRNRNDAYSQAMQNAIAGGGQEQQLQQQLAMGGLAGLQGLSGMPGFQAGPNYLGAAGMANDYNLQATQLNNQAASDAWGGAAGLAGAGVDWASILGRKPPGTGFAYGGGNNAGTIGVG